MVELGHEMAGGMINCVRKDPRSEGKQLLYHNGIRISVVSMLL